MNARKSKGVNYRALYLQLLNEAAGFGITVYRKKLKSAAAGLCKGDKIAISKNIYSYKKRAQILAEEIAHCLFTVGDILDTNQADSRIQEELARLIAEERIKGNPYPLRLAPPGSKGYYIYISMYLDNANFF